MGVTPTSDQDIGSLDHRRVQTTPTSPFPLLRLMLGLARRRAWDTLAEEPPPLRRPLELDDRKRLTGQLRPMSTFPRLARRLPILWLLVDRGLGTMELRPEPNHPIAVAHGRNGGRMVWMPIARAVGLLPKRDTPVSSLRRLGVRAMQARTNGVVMPSTSLGSLYLMAGGWIRATPRRFPSPAQSALKRLLSVQRGTILARVLMTKTRRIRPKSTTGPRFSTCLLIPLARYGLSLSRIRMTTKKRLHCSSRLPLPTRSNPPRRSGRLCPAQIFPSRPTR